MNEGLLHDRSPPPDVTTPTRHDPELAQQNGLAPDKCIPDVSHRFLRALDELRGGVTRLLTQQWARTASARSKPGHRYSAAWDPVVGSPPPSKEHLRARLSSSQR